MKTSGLGKSSTIRRQLIVTIVAKAVLIRSPAAHDELRGSLRPI
jgi:hypothetical protein